VALYPLYKFEPFCVDLFIQEVVLMFVQLRAVVAIQCCSDQVFFFFPVNFKIYLVSNQFADITDFLGSVSADMR
jgi:hypothetical protein